MPAWIRPFVRTLAPVVVGIAAASFAWYRLGPVTRGTGWAEDAGIFLRERLAAGPLDTLFTPYAGYLHLLPRLTVDLAVALPVQDYALTVAATSCAVAGAVCGGVFALARPVVPAWPLRLVLAAVPVALPIAPYEVSGSAANQHWFLLVLAPWLYAFRPRSRWTAGVLGAVALVAGLTEPQTAVFLPLLVLAWLPARSDGDRGPRLLALPVTVGAVVALALQAVTALTADRVAHPERPGTRDAVAGYLLQVLGGTATVDPSRSGSAVLTHGWVVLVLPAVVLLVVVVVAVVLATWRTRVVLLALGTGSVLLWYVAVFASGGAADGYASGDPAVYGALTPVRYAVVPAVLLLSCLVVAASVLVRSGDARARPAAAEASPAPGRDVAAPTTVRRGRTVARVSGALLGWCVVTAVVASSVLSASPGQTRRSAGTPWQPQVLAGVAACRSDPEGSLRIAAVPWAASVPCDLVLAGVR